ncbi:MAG TPA: hypothetical protein VK031_02515 [Tissierellaceae bacterium]|nr:hypothetical protein [Tissierellaceae bacterium]
MLEQLKNKNHKFNNEDENFIDDKKNDFSSRLENEEDKLEQNDIIALIISSILVFGPIFIILGLILKLLI